LTQLNSWCVSHCKDGGGRNEEDGPAFIVKSNCACAAAGAAKGSKPKRIGHVLFISDSLFKPLPETVVYSRLPRAVVNCGLALSAEGVLIGNPVAK
jgi:hypothetical protein